MQIKLENCSPEISDPLSLWLYSRLTGSAAAAVAGGGGRELNAADADAGNANHHRRRNWMSWMAA